MATRFPTAPPRVAHPIPLYGRGVSLRRRYHPVPGLADDPDFMRRAEWGHDGLDCEREWCTWPELMDQTQIGRWCGSPLAHDDVEDDDPDTGIEDEPHDAREEDGL